MTRCAVLLRGVNVGGNNRIAMADLRSLLERVGGRDVATYVQSGNGLLTWEAAPEALEQAVEAALRDELDLPVRALVRTADELAAAVAACPFPDPDPKLVHVVFLSGRLDPEHLAGADVAPDRVELGDRLLYVQYADGSQSSKASKLLTSKRFPLVATARNWRTVLALRDMTGS